MEQNNNLRQQDSSNTFSIIITIVGILLAVVGLIYSIAPFFGAFAFPFGIIGIFVSVFFIKSRSKKGQKKLWSIVGLVVSLIISTVSFINYLNHRDAVNIILGVSGAEQDALIVPENSPIREAVERGEGYSKEEIKARKERIEKKKAQEAKSNTPFLKTKDEKQGKPGLDPNIGIIERKAPLGSYYYSLVDHLRIRATSDNTSEVIDHIHYGEQVEYMGEKTAEKQALSIGGKERNDYWYKVKAINSSRREGWVYGGALLNASQAFSEEAQGLVMPINFIDRDSLENLIGRRPYGGYNYSGLVGFKRDNDNRLIPDGRFYFDGFSKQSYYGIQEYGEEGRVGGSLKNGKLHGSFKEVVGLFESSIDLEIDYDNGTCKSYKMIENQEGEIYESKSSDPEDCGVDFIESKLKYVK